MTALPSLFVMVVALGFVGSAERSVRPLMFRWGSEYAPASTSIGSPGAAAFSPSMIVLCWQALHTFSARASRVGRLMAASSARHSAGTVLRRARNSAAKQQRLATFNHITLASGTERVKISPGLGGYPKWSPDGTELFYTNDSSEYFSVAIDTTEDVLNPGRPELMFRLPDGEYTDFFDVTPDGQRFLFGSLPEKEGNGQNHPVVVVNWFKELREKMATVKGR